MDKILDVWEEDFQARVQPGVGWQSLNEELKRRGVKLFFPVDPAPGSEFGGMVGVAGSGTNAVGYGTMRAEWITSLEVVLMDGTVLRTKGTNRARKSTTGWDTARLFMGSEGTLGIITELTVRLAPVIPLKVALTSFPSVAQAVDSVVDILTAGMTPTSLELLDGTSVRGLNLANLLPQKLEEQPTVLMRFSNSSQEVNEMALYKVAEIVKKRGGSELRVAKDEKENEELWTARKSQYWSQQLLIGEGCRTLITDVCVPISRLAEFVAVSEKYVRESGLVAPIVAHIGDGNVHRAILWKSSPGETAPPAAVEPLAKKLVHLAQSLDGTCAGEHGIGLTKRKYLRSELGQGTLQLVRTVKRALDPLNLLNPGKVLFDEGEEEGQ
ncbi:D-lactate ferricytochrome c oxidoreductase [Rhodosporidiobolus nylandii]